MSHKKKVLTGFLVLSISAFTYSSCNKHLEKKADLVLLNGTIYTIDENRPEAEALAIERDRFVFVGNNAGAKKYITEKTTVIDLKDKTVTPGLIDSHVHLEWYGRYQEEVHLHGTTNFDDVLKIVEQHVKRIEPGEWIIGAGWDHEDWPDKKLPTHERLSAISPQNPVLLERDGAHSVLVNQTAMNLAGIDEKTKNIKGGQIIRDSKTGAPTGIFVDRAKTLISSIKPQPSYDDRVRYILNAVDSCISVGLTSVHDAGVFNEPSLAYQIIDIFKSLAENGRLKNRVYAMLGGNEVYLDNYFQYPPMIGYGNHHLTFRSIKIALDGAMGSRGALLLDEYSDMPGHRGSVVTESDAIKKIAIDAVNKDFQLNVHAIGDSASRLSLDLFEEVDADYPIHERRFRIEHLQLISLEDIPRLEKLGVIPSMQAYHAISDMNWAETRVGKERVKGNYAWRKVLDSGVIIAGGSDIPVVPINPLWSIYASVTRRDIHGLPEEGGYPEERMSREEALKSYTIWGAYAAFEEKLKGSIEVGKLADLVVFSKDITKIAAEELLTTKALLTIVGGDIVYKRKEFE